MKSLLFGIFLLFCGKIYTLNTNEILEEEFKLFQIQHGKKYNTQSEHDFRMQNFINNKLMIAMHNQKYYQGQSTFTMGINQFADQSPNEIAEMFQKVNLPVQTEHEGKKMAISENGKEYPPLPDRFDWRALGAVTSVKNQGDCKAGWAFAAAASLEGKYFNTTGKLIDFSVQQFIDCGKELPGCENNYPVGLYDSDCFSIFWSFGHGFEAESDYPFEGKKGLCRADKTKTKAKVWSFTGRKGCEICIAGILANSVPLAVIIDAQLSTFIFYNHGIYNDPSCKSDENSANHAVLAVGYDTDLKDGAYWILKNSWGTNWGEKGYVRLARNHNQCGIGNFGIFPNFEML